VQRIARGLELAGDAVFNNANRAPAALKREARLRADERVAPGLIALLDRFEKERVAAVVDLLEGGDGRIMFPRFASSRNSTRSGLRGVFI